MATNSLTGTLRETLALFDSPVAPWTTSEIASELDLGRRSTYDRLERLVEQDRLRTKKVGANGRVWWRPPATDDTGDRDGHTEFDSLVDPVEEYAIFLLDPDGHVRTWNSGAHRIIGYTEAEIVGQHVSTFYTAADCDDDAPQRNLRAATQAGEVKDEGWRVRADGSRFWADVTITAIRDDDGELTGFAEVTRDMTERHTHEEQLRQEHDFTQWVLNTAPVGVVLFQEDGTFTSANQRADELLGLDDEPHDIDGNEVRDENGDPLAPSERPYMRVFDTGEPVRGEQLHVPTGDGDHRWVAVNAEPLTAEDGAVERVLVTIEDISQLKHQAERLERERNQASSELDAIFERVDDAFFAVDDDWRFTYVNDTAADLVGRSTAEMLGACLWDAFPRITEGLPRERAERAMETGESTEFEFYSDPLEMWVEIRLYPSADGLSVYFRDVSDRVAREQELEESRRRYQTLIDNFPNGAVTLVDEDLQYVTVGGTPHDVGVDIPADINGTALEEILPPDLSELLIPRYEAALAGEASSFEATLDGGCYRFEIVPVRDDDGAVFAALGMSQEITERKEYEQQLQRRIRQQEAVATLGRQALETEDLDELMADTARLVADVLDNDYSKVLDLAPDGQELRLRQGVGWTDGIVGSATVSATENDSQAAYTLASADPVRVDDLATEERFSGPDLLTDHDVRSGISTIIGSVDDPWGILGTHDTEPKEFSQQDVAFVESVANILAPTIRRQQDEQTLRIQRERLAALNDLNEVSRELTTAAIEQSTRDEIEQTVCDYLARSESYTFAWIGDVDTATGTVTMRAEAGVDGYLDDITISVDPDDERGQGPTGRALRTGRLQVTNDIRVADHHDPWREHTEQYGFKSSAAIPIVHEDTVYGALNVYADRPEAFGGDEQDLIAQLGEIVGHVIAAAERKQALMSDELVELDFHMDRFLDELGVSMPADERITFEKAVPGSDDEFLVYGTATPGAVEAVHDISDALDHWEAVEVRDNGDPQRFEIRMSDPPILSTVASLGGYVEEAVVVDGDIDLRIHLAPSVDVRRVVDAVEAAYPTAELRRRRQVTRAAADPQRIQRELLSRLTEKQRGALEAAYHKGFFEWPRDAVGEDIADSLGVATPTFHQHLRKAEAEVFDALLSTETPS
ncbi:PAS sensor protein [Halobacteriales archaeon QS_6_64_34]|nr:MAG: PAS sensor protein [Halobacteriales archaeon QS_6_64_34]